METVKRIITFIFALFMAVFLLLLTAVVSGIVPWHMLDEYVRSFIGRFEPTMACLAAFLWCLLVMAMSFFGGKPSGEKRGSEIVVSDANGAKVKISQKVMTDVAEAAALAVVGVRGAKAKIKPADGDSKSLVAAMTLTVDARQGAAEIGEQVRGAVKNAVETASSLNVKSVEVEIGELWKKPET